MDVLTLQVTERNILGKKTRFLRRQGITPVHLIGHGIESLALQCDTTQLQQIIAKAGITRPIAIKLENEKQPRSVFVREVQRNPLNRQLYHVDFYQVKKGEKIKVEVPIILVGTAPAMREKGRLITHGITDLSVECLPEKLPSQIEVDLSPLEDLESAIHVKDIVLDPEITVHADPDQLVVKVSEITVRAVEEAPVEAVAEEAAEEAAAAAEAPSKGAGEQKSAG